MAPGGQVLAIDRSARAIDQLVGSSLDLIDAGLLVARAVAIEDLVLPPDEPRYDLAFAVRVGALDGRHPETADLALDRIARSLVPGGQLLIDGGDPLRAISIPTPPAQGERSPSG